MTTFGLTGLDFTITSNKFVLVDGIEEVKQRLDSNLQFFKGEWFLDQRLGMPYYEEVLGQKPRIAVIQNVFRDGILQTSGVTGTSDPILDFDSPTRTLSVEAQVTCESGVFYYEKEFVV
ncbi:MAG: hypothetical protein GY847_06510 [Proteobacteria bacterium]|nr:hypothetical protein [Pseudomonadota bacterium]